MKYNKLRHFLPLAILASAPTYGQGFTVTNSFSPSSVISSSQMNTNFDEVEAQVDALWSSQDNTSIERVGLTSGNLRLKAGGVTAAHIATNAVTLAKIDASAGVTGNVIKHSGGVWTAANLTAADVGVIFGTSTGNAVQVQPGSQLPALGGTALTSAGPLTFGGDVILGTGNFIVNSGNLGVGTASPSTKLDVVGNGGSVVDLVSVHNDSTAGINIGGAISFKGDTGAGVPIGQVAAAFDTGSNASSFLSFSTREASVVTEKMRIKSSGAVGLGTIQPSARLEVKNNIGGTNTRMTNSDYVAGSTGSVLQFYSSAISGIADSIIEAKNAGATAPGNLQLNPTGGTVAIGTSSPNGAYALHVVGLAGLSTGTAWTNISDSRLKDVHGPYTHGLAEVLKLNPVRFNYKKGNPLKLPSDQSMTGFIAQNVMGAIPEAVTTNTSGYLQLNVDPIHWAMVNAVKELSAQVKDLEAKLQTRELASASEGKKDQEYRAMKMYLCAKDPNAPFCKK